MKNKTTKARKILNFRTSKEEMDLIHKIAVRAVEMGKELGTTVDLLSLEMDISACHLNGNPLDLAGLLDSRNGDFSHDVFGIRRHINRATGELEDFFDPRFSKRNQDIDLRRPLLEEEMLVLEYVKQNPNMTNEDIANHFAPASDSIRGTYSEAVEYLVNNNYLDRDRRTGAIKIWSPK